VVFRFDLMILIVPIVMNYNLELINTSPRNRKNILLQIKVEFLPWLNSLWQSIIRCIVSAGATTSKVCYLIFHSNISHTRINHYSYVILKIPCMTQWPHNDYPNEESVLAEINY